MGSTRKGKKTGTKLGNPEMTMRPNNEQSNDKQNGGPSVHNWQGFEDGRLGTAQISSPAMEG